MERTDGRRVHAEVDHGVLDPGPLLEWARTEQQGAVTLFVGTVRRRNRERTVTRLTYEAYTEMARDELERIATEALERFEVDRVAARHRLGELSPGEVSVAIAVGGAHRDPCYAASRYVIEELKQRLPVWKREAYEDGASEWLDGRASERDDEPARVSSSAHSAEDDDR